MDAVLAALCEPDPDAKCALVAALGPGSPAAAPGAPAPGGIPGRPARPRLVDPRAVPNRGLGTPAGRAALVHAVAHIEFNAVNLALDAAWRFAAMPDEFRADWIGVAQDEARHFLLLRGRLRELGHEYGDFAAHDGLWEAATKTAHDPLARMALVPRVLEARGLDVTPGLIRRLAELRDERTVAVLRVILEEEVRHVAVGTRWFRWLCAQRALPPRETFLDLLRQHGASVRAPLNLPARRAAGFDDDELLALAPPSRAPPPG